MAVCYQETGEEGVIVAEPGETDEQLRERVPDEWRFRYFEDTDAAYQRALKELDYDY
jgi:broad specificity phosphatase PhoE